MNLHLIFLVFAFVLFVLAGCGVPNPPRVGLGWFGLAALTLALWLH
jgi:hypothetical protein